MRKIFLLFMTLGLLLCVSSYAADGVTEQYAYKVKVATSSLISGQELGYYLTDDKIIVFGKLKFSDPAKELFLRELTEPEKETMNDFLAKFPLSKLNNEYFSKDSIMDGYSFNFSFKLEKNSPREIRLANTDQKDLNALVKEINLLLPENLKLFADW